MHPSATAFRCAAATIAAVLVLGATHALATAPAASAGPKQGDGPLYSSSQTGLEHFVQDQLGAIVAGKAWTWGDHAYQSVRLHRVVRTRRFLDRQAGRDYSAGVRGWTIALIEVRVDGELKTGKITVNASYAWEPATWVFDEALLYLGGAESFDFVSGSVR